MSSFSFVLGVILARTTPSRPRPGARIELMSLRTTKDQGQKPIYVTERYHATSDLLVHLHKPIAYCFKLKPMVVPIPNIVRLNFN